MIVLDYQDKRPLYEQIIEKVSELILAGVLPEHAPLPSVRSLAMELSINPNTIQRAYQELERRGIIYSVKGKGSFAAGIHDLKKQKQEEVLKRFSELIKEAGKLEISKEQLMDEIERVYERGECT